MKGQKCLFLINKINWKKLIKINNGIIIINNGIINNNK